LLACGAALSFGQFKTELINQEGATAPCVGIGPVGGPLAKKCTELFEQAGFIRVDEVGAAGLTIGTTGKDDGLILAVQNESAATHAGLEVGDAIIALEGKPVRPTPGMIAEKAMFGRRGEALRLMVRRNSALQEVSLVRSPQGAPEGPKSHNIFVLVRPLINWRGQFVPCMGAGPLAPVVLDVCNSHFKPYGYIKTGDFASTGFQLDLVRADSAIVSTVEPGSAAGKAGILPGDEIVDVDGHPLTASVGKTFTERIFGKIGDQFHVTVRHGQTDKTVLLQLAAKAKE
jgi:C-terminal processing protease CtpA/Prc